MGDEGCFVVLLKVVQQTAPLLTLRALNQTPAGFHFTSDKRREKFRPTATTCACSRCEVFAWSSAVSGDLCLLLVNNKTAHLENHEVSGDESEWRQWKLVTKFMVEEVQFRSVQFSIRKVAPSTSTTTTTRFCFCTRGGEHCRNCGGVFVAVCVDCLPPKKESAHWCKKSAHRRSGKGCGRGCLYGGTQKKYGGGYTH